MVARCGVYIKYTLYHTDMCGIRNVRCVSAKSRESPIMSKKSVNIEINVVGNADRALRQLKKKVEREGVVRDMKRTVYFEPATQKRRKRLVRSIKLNLMRQISQGIFKQKQ